MNDEFVKQAAAILMNLSREEMDARLAKVPLKTRRSDGSELSMDATIGIFRACLGTLRTGDYTPPRAPRFNHREIVCPLCGKPTKGNSEVRGERGRTEGIVQHLIHKHGRSMEDAQRVLKTIA